MGVGGGGGSESERVSVRQLGSPGACSPVKSFKFLSFRNASKA